MHLDVVLGDSWQPDDSFLDEITWGISWVPLAPIYIEDYLDAVSNPICWVLLWDYIPIHRYVLRLTHGE